MLTIRSALASDKNELESKVLSSFDDLVIPSARREASATVPTPKPAARLPKDIKRLKRVAGTALCLAVALNWVQTRNRKHLIIAHI